MVLLHMVQRVTVMLALPGEVVKKRRRVLAAAGIAMDTAPW